MKSRVVRFTGPGKLLITEEDIPAPDDSQVLVQMKACGICQYDKKCFLDTELNPSYSKKPGHEGVGIVREIGRKVGGLAVGDRVTSNMFGGAFADYFIANPDTLVRIPDHVDNFELWVSEPAACVVSSLRLLRIEPGFDVVLLGAGYMGQLFVQAFPKTYIKLVVVDTDDERLAMASENGADITVNPERDGLGTVREIFPRGADLVVEAVGLPGLIKQGTDMLRNAGRLCIFGHHAADETVPTDDWHMKGIEVLNTTPFSSADFHRDLSGAVKLMEKGVINQSGLISKTYALSELAGALRDLASGRCRFMKTAVRNEK